MHDREVFAQSDFATRIKSHIKRTIAKAKRRGAWFSLDRKEKSILYLSVRLKLKFEGLDLLRSLASILKKLQCQGDTIYAWFQRGTRLAWAFSEFAVSCGNETARAWRNDRSYALYLGKVLSSGGWGISLF